MKKEDCAAEFDSMDDKKKVLERSTKDEDTVIAESEDALASTKDEVKALVAEVRGLDKAVAEATEQRKEENEAHQELMAQDSTAKEVILFAKNRLNKFYNPVLYTPPAKRELSEGTASTGFAPPPLPQGG